MWSATSKRTGYVDSTGADIGLGAGGVDSKRLRRERLDQKTSLDLASTLSYEGLELGRPTIRLGVYHLGGDGHNGREV